MIILTWIVFHCFCIFLDHYHFTDNLNSAFAINQQSFENNQLAYQAHWPFERNSRDIERVEPIVVSQNTWSERPSIFSSFAGCKKLFKESYLAQQFQSASFIGPLRNDSVFLCKIQV